MANLKMRRMGLSACVFIALAFLCAFIAPCAFADVTDAAPASSAILSEAKDSTELQTCESSNVISNERSDVRDPLRANSTPDGGDPSFALCAPQDDKGGASSSVILSGSRDPAEYQASKPSNVISNERSDVRDLLHSENQHDVALKAQAGDSAGDAAEPEPDPEPPYEEYHVNMYRLYNPNSGEHFYTGELVEARSVAEAGWRWEGVGWVAPITSKIPVFRLYNPYAGDHHYTTEENERDNLVSLGWNYEGVGWYSDGNDQLAVWRQYNPNAVAGAHNFTKDASEDEYLGEVGWNREGLAWYATDGANLIIQGFWLVTNAWGSLERYWVGTDALIAKYRLLDADEVGWDAYATGSGAVVRGKYDRGDGYVYVADNDGRLAATASGEDGWIVTDVYDGGMQRYYYVASEHAMRSGFFEVDGSKYFGMGGQGYVLRGRTNWGDHVLLADNAGRMATGTGWLVTDAYDGGMQRYWLDDVWSGYSGARTGMFDVDGASFYGIPGVGYVARNKHIYLWGTWYWADNDGVLSGANIFDVKNMLLNVISSADGSSALTVLGDTPYSFASASGVRLANAVNNIRGSGSDVGFVMMDLTTGYGVACSPHDVRYSASTIKGPYVAAINHYDPWSVDGYTGSLMDGAIRYSSNEDYDSLRYMYGGGIMQNQFDYCDVHLADSGRWYPYYSAADLAKLWVGNYWYFTYDTNENSAWCRDLYSEGLVGEDAIIHNALSYWYTVYTKPGWYPGEGYDVQNDAGIVMAGDHPYVLAFMSSACMQYGALEELVRALDDVHAEIVY